VTLRDIQEESRTRVVPSTIHPDRIPQIQVPDDNTEEAVFDNCELSQSEQILQSAELFVKISRKERQAFNKKKKGDLLLHTRSGRIIAHPLSNKQRNDIQSIPKPMLAEYLRLRK
jgi:hypothetical protein